MRDSLVHRFQDAARRTPDAEAVIYKDERVSYGELWAMVCSVSHFLRERGLKQGDRVGILVENSPAYVTTYYGALGAGGAAVALNMAAKARDIINWLRHSGASWLVASGRHPELVQVMRALGDTVNVVVVGDSSRDFPVAPAGYWSELSVSSGTALDLSVIAGPDQLAAIIYTSGTTGRPKGVTLSHGNLASNTASIQAYLHLTAHDRILNVLPFYYSYGNSVLHTHLTVGASLVLENSLMYPSTVMERMVNERVTGFSGVPSTFALLMSRTRMMDYDLSSVRYMTQAGGPMPPASIARLLKDVPHIEFFVMYGQTEASARLTYLPPDRLSQKVGSVGIPIPGVEIEVRDETGRVVPEGVTGEICARGPNIMLGYWNDPEMTEQVVRDGWLHTGDLAHVDTEGFIYIDGRSVDMIKSGANRISPKEIEEVLAELEGVEEVAVVGVPDEILGQVIKAVIVPRPGVQLEPKTVRAHCKKNLADYKVPRFIDFTDELPKTASGKVKRFQLHENYTA